MKRCLSLLKAGGELIALVPITYQHENAILLKTLDNSTFAHAKVNTKIILITQ